MIRIDKSQTIEGSMVYGDDTDAHVFYVLPDQPRFRIDDNGHPVFKLLKYRNPITHRDGTTGGGFVIFDSEFVVPTDKMQKIVKVLTDQLTSRQIKIAPEIRKLTFIKGAAQLQLLDSGGALVQKILSAGKPSLYGNNICSFTAELSQEGATLAEQAFQGSGGVAQVIYDLYFSAALGPITGHVYFHASKAYSFFESITKEDHWYSSPDNVTQTIQESLVANQWGGVDFDFSSLGNMPDQDEANKIQKQIRDWGTQALEDAIKTQIPPDIAPQEDRGDDGYTNFTRHINVVHISDVNQFYRENQAVQWHVLPQGTLPNITGLDVSSGGKLKWSDYCSTVDLDDPFFRQIHVKARVNADFQKFPIESVDLHLEYNDGTKTTTADANIKSPDTLLALDAYVGNNSYKYKYKYDVNYKDSSYKYLGTLIETENASLTIDVGDLGLIYVAIGTGAINFNEVQQVQVAIKYQDAADGASPIEQEFVIDKNNRSYQFQHVLKTPWNRPYSYDLLYVMSDGKQWSKRGLSSQSEELYINDPFSDTRNVSVMATGDLDTDVAYIALDLQYDDEKNNYHVRAQPTVLGKTNAFFQWAVPVIDPTAGKVTYSGQIVYKKGAPGPIPLTVASSDSIFVGPQDQMQITVDPSALDFSAASGLKFVKVTVHYADAANQVELRKDIMLKPTTQAQAVAIDLRDARHTQFDWQPTYFVVGPNGAIAPKAGALTTDPGGEVVTINVLPPA
jgi:hypothetical protein